EVFELGGHLVLGAPVHYRNVVVAADKALCGARTGPCTVDSRKPAANDDDVAVKLANPAVVVVVHELQAGNRRVRISTRQLGLVGQHRTNSQKYCVELAGELLDEGPVRAHAEVGLYAGVDNKRNFLLDSVPRQPELGNS